MHFRTTEFKQALRNEDFESLLFIDGDGGASRMELTVRLSSVYREKMVWCKLTSHAAAEGVGNVLDAGAFRALREVLEPLCLYASSHVAFKRTLVAALNHLIFDDGRLVQAKPTVEGPFMDPALTEAHSVLPQVPYGELAGAAATAAPPAVSSAPSSAAAAWGSPSPARGKGVAQATKRSFVKSVHGSALDGAGSWRGGAATHLQTSSHGSSRGRPTTNSAGQVASSLSYAALLRKAAK